MRIPGSLSSVNGHHSFHTETSTSDTDKTAMIGQTTSHYTILERLGQGGMGIVYKAQDTKLGRFVAMKFLPPQVSDNPEQISRFETEAKASSAIDHPNIASIYEISETENGLIYIVMAYYEGKTVKELIQGGPLSIDDTVNYASQVAHGLAKAHSNGIVHRDLKPANVIITKDGIAKIIDFGLAKLSGGAQMTKTGIAVGTVGYMSPEQVRGEDVDETTDIWSLGVMLYEMLTGQLPFLAEYEHAMMYLILNEEPPPITSRRDDIPLELQRIVEKALTKERKARYQHMDEVVRDLEALRTSTGEVSPLQIASHILQFLTRRHRKKLIIGLATVLALSIALVVWQKTSHHAPSLINRSIAILPFRNSGDSSTAYFSESFVQDIATELSTIPQLRVISTQSTFLINSSGLNDDSITSQLGVGYLMRGDLKISPARASINLHLFSGVEHTTAWSHVYECVPEDIVNVKEEIFKSIMEYFGIPSDSILQLRQKPGAEVYDLYLHGLYHYNKVTKAGNKTAYQYYSEVVSKDSSYIPGLLGLASTEIENFQYGWNQSEKYLFHAEEMCKKTLRIDSNRADAIAMLGNIAELHQRRNEAIELFQKALTKDKNNIYALSSLQQIYLMEMNQADKALIYLQRIQELDPLDWMTNQALGVAYAQTKDYQSAKRFFRRTMMLKPDHDWPPYNLGYVCERLGEIDSALHYYNTAIQINPKFILAYNSLISDLVYKKDFTAAESTILRNRKELLDEPEMYYLLGVVDDKQGHSSTAIEQYQVGLKLIEEKISKNPQIADYAAYAGLFQARLGNISEAVRYASKAANLDSTNEEVAMKITRIYAILGKKVEMLKWFRNAKGMNPEYDEPFLTTALDFDKFRKDPDLILVARSEQ